MSDSIAQAFRAPIGKRPLGQRMYWTWHRRPVTVYHDTVGRLRELLPVFSRNRNCWPRDQVLLPNPANPQKPAVVGRVSSEYFLVQHHHLLNAVAKIMADQGFDLDSMPADLTITDQGERMELKVDLTPFSTIPPDGHVVNCRLRCLNSVDGSTALEGGLQWYRQICTNGMFGWAGERIRHIHRHGDVLDWVMRRLAQRFEAVSGDRKCFEKMIGISITSGNLRDWIDVFVTRRWDSLAAARVYHICQTGWDATAIDYDPDCNATGLKVSPTVEVPGACAPVHNAYHIAQALSWVAGQADTLERRFSRTTSVATLMRQLIN